MPQNPFQGKQPLGVLYNTSVARPDSVLALALLYGYEGKREARMTAIAVNDAGLEAAIFCDILVQFYTLRGGTPMNSNRFLPVGLVATNPLPPSPLMLKNAVEKRDEKGEPVYSRTIRRIADTSEVSAMIRNSLTGVQDKNSVMILSAPANDLDRSLALAGTREYVAAKIKLLVVVESTSGKDPAALRRVLAAWPTPVVFCPRALGEAVLFPASSIEKDFEWAPAHPVVDAYRAFRPMPYDSATLDLAAAVYAVHPELGFFEATEEGTIQVGDDGKLRFEVQVGGKHKRLKIVEAKKADLLKHYTEVASAKPVMQQPRIRPLVTDQKKAATEAKPLAK